MDISEEKVKNIVGAVVGNLEDSKLFCTNEFDSIICVGSVINYCNSYRVVENFYNWIKNEGTLYLEFENSSPFEYAFTKKYGRAMDIVKTEYIECEHLIYIYSYAYLTSLLEINNFEILEIKGFHILSSLVLRFGFSEEFSAKFTSFDNLLNKISFFRNHSANIIIKCKKSKK